MARRSLATPSPRVSGAAAHRWPATSPRTPSPASAAASRSTSRCARATTSAAPAAAVSPVVIVEGRPGTQRHLGRFPLTAPSGYHGSGVTTATYRRASATAARRVQLGLRADVGDKSDVNGSPDVFLARSSPAPRSGCPTTPTARRRPRAASTDVSISADGATVAFDSTAPDLVADDTNGRSDVFVWTAVDGHQPGLPDRHRRPGWPAGHGREGEQAAGDLGRRAVRRVPVQRARPDLDPGAAGQHQLQRLRSRPDRRHHDPGLADDGRTSARHRRHGSPVDLCRRPVHRLHDCRGSTLSPDDTNGVSDVFVYDQTTKTTTRVSVDSAGRRGRRCELCAGAVQRRALRRLPV